MRPSPAGPTLPRVTFSPRPFHPNRPQLIAPVRTDPTGRSGPTPRQVRGRAWRRSSRGLHVPATEPTAPLEQRIVEAAATLPPGGAVTGWASLRWYGALWFDGRTPDDRAELPVPLVSCVRDIRPQPGFSLSQERLDPRTVVEVDGLPVTTGVRSVCFEMRYAAGVRAAVAALDMAMFSDVVSLAEVAAYVDPHLNGWTGVPQAREALALAEENSWSPRETAMRLVWVMDAGLPRPLCNRPVFDLHGRLLGTPDLFDPEAGVVGEYDGAVHLDGSQRSTDVTREEVFRDHGLEYFCVVGGDMVNRRAVAARMHAARRRARCQSPDRRAWTLTTPHWWTQTHTVALRRALTGPALERVRHRQRRLPSRRGRSPRPDSP